VGEMGKEMTFYKVRFDQIPGVKEGSSVLLASSPIGQVSAIDAEWIKDQKTGGKRFDYYVLTLEIPRDVRLYQNAHVAIETKLIGEGAAINILSVGDDEPVGGRITEPIIGRSGTAMGSAVEALGIGEEQKKQISETIANITQLSKDLREKVPAILASVRQGAERLNKITEKIDGILAENRPNVKSSIDNINALTADTRKKLGTLTENLVETTNNIRGLVAANSTNINSVTDNLRRTSEELKAASIEIRRAPWRLLHKPDKREADTLNIFDASRNYATAVGDLRSTTTTLDSLTKLHAEGVPVDKKMLLEMLDRVRASLRKYEEAEDALWKEWAEVDK
ncbi:MAG: hypothetical protein GWP05_08895, partial [Anaerolineaceae bacterium]|nr:hypothetical protein [Anaerolineaceae bacterium]